MKTKMLSTSLLLAMTAISSTAASSGFQRVAGAECVADGSPATAVSSGGAVFHLGTASPLRNFACPIRDFETSTASAALSRANLTLVNVHVFDGNNTNSTLGSVVVNACIQDPYSATVVCGNASALTSGTGVGFSTVAVPGGGSASALGVLKDTTLLHWFASVVVALPGAQGSSASAINGYFLSY